MRVARRSEAGDFCIPPGSSSSCFRCAFHDKDHTALTQHHAVAIAVEEPASQPDGAFQTIADEQTAPKGVSFVSPTSDVHVDVISVATLGPSEQVAIWVRRSLAAATASARSRLGIEWSYRAVG